MNITEIRHQSITTYEPRAFKNAEVVKKADVVASTSAARPVQDPAWQKNILLDAITSLENNIQADNSHPLSRADYQPIDTFSEALSELKFFSSDMFKSQASSAQANLNAEDIVSLFVDTAVA